MTLKTITASVLAPIARAITATKPRVLFYHRFGRNNSRAMTPELFEQQVLFLKKHFTLVPLSTLTDALKAGRSLPRNVVALTVDDGYADFLHLAYPVIKKHQVPITLFIVSAFSTEHTWLWYDRVRFVCRNAGTSRVSFKTDTLEFNLNLSDEVAREAAWDTICSKCLTLSTDKRQQVLAAFETAAQVSLPSAPPEEFRGISPQELCSMDSTLVEVGAHTCTHVILASCDEQEQRAEIQGSKESLERLIGRTVQHFAYPNGQERDFNEISVSLVRASRFKGAVTTKNTLVEKGTSEFSVPRLCASFDMNVFRSEVNGLSYLSQRFNALRAK